MIVSMKKTSIVVLTREREELLARLREIGVLHIEARDAQSGELGELQERRAAVQRSIRLLEQIRADADSVSAAGAPDLSAEQCVERVQEVTGRKQELYEQSLSVRRELERQRVWGDFKPEDISELRARGVNLRLYALSRSELDAFPEGVPSFIVSRRKGLTCVAAVPSDDELAEFPEFRLPARSLSELEVLLESLEDDLRGLDDQLVRLSVLVPVLAEELRSIDESIDYERARLSFGDEEELSHVTGYIPEDKRKDLESAARRHGWGLLIRDPEPEDPVPTLVRNPKPVRIISPVFKMLGTVPGYREYDISFLFLLFFVIFFSMIVGDAGYGLVFLGVSVVAMVRGRKKGARPGRELALLTVLSVFTVVWGAMTGTWFGSEAIAGTRPFSMLVVPAISSFNPQSAENIKHLSFILGAAHILIAHGWRFLDSLRRKPRIRAIAQLGWIAAVLGLYFLVLNLVLDPVAFPLPGASLYLMGGGVAMVVLFGEQEGNFFRGVARGVGGLLTTFLGGIGAFADIISYIRLFAVGLATVEIARSFNGMAADMGYGVVGIAGAVLILGMGHALNIAMAALSVVVHGVRLNMLEFSGHLGMEWTGRPYTPFSYGGGDTEQ